jgi:pSer/pThr/pTyr-binding forkhead associated (FHA) protein
MAIMTLQINGELAPVGGGDIIPLIRDRLVIGRRETCDIPLRLPNVSGMHCELHFRKGFWWLRDLGSTNGVKVNGLRVLEKLLHPGDTITIAKKSFTIDYTPPVGQRALEEILEEEEDVMGQSLLEKAGLVRPRRDDKRNPNRPAAANADYLLLGEEEEDEDED